jgi:hypothetical protein
MSRIDDSLLSAAMIEAGLEVLRRFNPESDFDELYVVLIWDAMNAAKQEEDKS